MVTDRLIPHEWQEADIERLLFWDCTGLAAIETGGGKSLLAVETVLRSGHHTRGAVLVIAPKSTFKKTWELTFQRQGGITPRRINSTKAGKEAELDLRFNTPGVYLINHELFARRDWDGVEPEICVVDECFVAGTMISTPTGEVSIESLKVGDEVWGFDHASGRVVRSTVTNLMQRDSMYVDSTIGATVNHPFFVEGVGYLPLADIEVGELGYYLSEAVSGGQDLSVVRAPIRGGYQKQEQRVLLSKLRTEIKDSAPPGTVAKDARGINGVGQERGGSPESQQNCEGDVGGWGLSTQGYRAYEGKQSVKRPRGHETRTGNKEAKWRDLRAFDGREREDCTRGGKADKCPRGWLGSFLRGFFGQEAIWVSNKLQNRLGAAGRESRGGVRWTVSQFTERSRTRRKEGRKVGGNGVDHLAILEPRNLERYHRVRLENLGSSATRVYNIETTTSNYFANRALVHNCHKMSNYALVTKNKRTSGAWRLVHFKAKRRLAMSATPYRNKFENMWTILRWLYPDDNQAGGLADRSFWRWADDNCIVEQDYFAGKVVRGEVAPGRLVSRIPCYIYHAKRNACCKWHPNGFMDTDEPEQIVRTVELTPAMKKAYGQLERDLVTWLGDNPLVVELPIVMRTRLRQMSLGSLTVNDDDSVTYAVDCESPKYDDLKLVLEDEIPDEPALVVTHSREFAVVLAEKLRRDGYTVAEWNGSLSQKQRDAEGERFANGEARVLVATIASLGTGTDFLQHVTSTIIWMSRTDDPTENKQTEGRLDRMGALGRVTSIEIQAEGTYDEGVLSKDLRHALELNASLAQSAVGY